MVQQDPLHRIQFQRSQETIATLNSLQTYNEEAYDLIQKLQAKETEINQKITFLEEEYNKLLTQTTLDKNTIHQWKNEIKKLDHEMRDLFKEKKRVINEFRKNLRQQLKSINYLSGKGNRLTWKVWKTNLKRFIVALKSKKEVITADKVGKVLKNTFYGQN